jgi:hypothetical protein
MISYSAEGFTQLRIGGEDGTTITISAEWFSWEKACAGDCTDGATLTAVLLRSEALGGVLDDFNAMLFGDCFESGVVSHLAEEVDRYNCFGISSNELLYLSGVDVVSVCLDVGEDRPCTDKRDGLCRTYPSEGGGDDFVAWTDAKGAECDFKCHRSASDGYAVEWFCPAKEFAEGGFEFIDLWTINVATVFKDFGDGGVNLRDALLMDGFDVDELHFKWMDGPCLSLLS